MYHLIPIPPDSKDIGSQKCHLDVHSMNAFNLKPEDLIIVKFNDIFYICLVWANPFVNKNCIRIDPFVSTNHLSVQSESFYKKNIFEFTSVSEKTSLANVSITLVTSSTKIVSKFRDKITHDILGVNGIVKNLLRKLYLSSEYIVNVQKTKLGKLYGIELLLVNDCSCAIGQFTNETMMNIVEVMSYDRYLQGCTKNTSICSYLHTEYSILISLISFQLRDYTHRKICNDSSILLIGPHGCGMKHLVQSICEELNAYLFKINGSQIFKSLPGESEEILRNIFKDAIISSYEGPCVLFISEIEILCPYHNKGSVEKRLLAQFISLLDKIYKTKNLVVIGATHQINAVHPNIRRHGRFGKEIFLKNPSIDERKKMLEALTKDLKLSANVDIYDIAEACPGFVITDLKYLVQQAVLNENMNCSEISDHDISMNSFKEALRFTQPCNRVKSDFGNDFKLIEWNDICGLNEVKKQIIQSIEWPLKYSESFFRLGIQPSKGVLLHGPPGCAKTSLVCAAATSCHVNFFSISGAQLYSSFVGDSEKKLRDIFTQARTLGPSILFIDELDSLVGKRQSNSSTKNVSDRILSTLLNELDGVGIHQGDSYSAPFAKNAQQIDLSSGKVVIVAATNRIDLIDDALLRPGRLDRIIEIPLPDKETRKNIIKMYMKNCLLENSDIDLVAEQTDSYSGADIENLCREVILQAMNERGLDVTEVSFQQFHDILKK